MTESVDLSAGEEGVMTDNLGNKWYCHMIENRGDYFLVRVRRAWYESFDLDGTPNDEYPQRAIMSFKPYTCKEAAEQECGKLPDELAQHDETCRMLR